MSDRESQRPAWAAPNPAWGDAKPLSPRPHQLEDVEALSELVRDGGKTTYVAACGTGKTLTSLWLAQALDARRIIVGLPSLALIEQTARSWAVAHDPANPLEMGALSSNAREDLMVERALAQEDSEVAGRTAPFRASTDPDEVSAYWDAPLADNTRRVLFFCYRSAEVLEKVLRMSNSPDVDLFLFDEAHRLAGKIDKQSSGIVLNERLIPGERRVFMTATPIFGRVDTDPTEQDVVKAAKSATARKALDRRLAQQFIGMDDPSIFGEIRVQRGFRWAIDNGVLTDYELVTPEPLSATAADQLDLMEERERERASRTSGPRHALPPGDIHKAYLLARELVLEPDGARQILSFHVRTADARRFGAAVRLFARQLGGRDIYTSALDGRDPMKRRKERLDRFNDGRPGLIASCNVLSEGVDAPSVDGVAFVSNRTSQVYISQAIGRAIRVNPKRKDKIARIIVPIPMREGQQRLSQSRQMLDEGQQSILQVLEAMGEIDERLGSYGRALRKARAARTPMPADLDALWASHVQLGHLSGVSEEERAAHVDGLRQAIVEQHAARFVDHYDACVDYAKVHGSVPMDSTTEWQGLAIGAFLSRWRVRVRTWRQAELEAAALPETTENRARRNELRRNTSDPRRELIEALPGWVLEPEEVAFRRGAERLAAWMMTHEREPSHTAKDAEERELGIWAKNRRAEIQAARGLNQHRSKLPIERQRYLQRVCPMFRLTLSPEELEAQRLHERQRARLEKAEREFKRRRKAGREISPDLIAATEALRALKLRERREEKAKPVWADGPESGPDLERWLRSLEAAEEWVRTEQRAPRRDFGTARERDIARWVMMETVRIDAHVGVARPLSLNQRQRLALLLADIEECQDVAERVAVGARSR